MDSNLSLVTNFIQKTKDSVCYLNISQSLMENLATQCDKDFKVIDLKTDISPLKPFSNVIVDCKPQESDIQEAFYSLHQKIVQDYIDHKQCEERKDIIIEQEYFYEKNRFKNSIVKLLEKLNTTKYIFLNSQFMFKESFEICKALEQSQVKGKFVFCFDSINTDIISKNSQDALEQLSSQRNFLNIPITEEAIQKSTSLKNSTDRFNIYAPYENLIDFSKICSALKNMRLFLSYEQGINMFAWLSENIGKLALSSLQHRKLMLEMAKICFDTDKLDEAALNLNSIIDTDSDDEIQMEALLYLTKIFAKKKANQTALKYCMTLKNKLESHKNQWINALNINMEYLVTLRKNDENAVDRYNYSMEVLKENGLMNNYISTALNIPWTLIDNPEKQEELHNHLDNCMKEARIIDNQHLISSICHRKAIILSHYGKTKEAMSYNIECNRIRTLIGEIQPILAIRNGLSYESLNTSNYTEAYNTVNDIIEALYTLNDYSSIIDTMKNITYAVFFSRDFNLAEKLFSLMLHFLTVFDLANAANNSFLPSTNDILIYRSLICIENGDFIHAQMNYINIMSNDNFISQVDQPFLNFIKASVFAEEGLLVKGKEAFKQCVEDFHNKSASQIHKIAFVYYEFANLLKKLGNPDEAEIYFKKGFKIAKENDLSYYTKGKENLTLEEFLDSTETLQPLKISLSFLQEKAEKDRLMNQLHHKLYDYQFLNRIKSYNGNTTSIKKYLESTLASMFDYAGANEIIISECSDLISKWKTICEVNRGKSSKIQSSLWDFYYNSTEMDSQLIWDEKNQLYYANLSKYEFKFGIVIVTGNGKPLNTDTVSTLNIALANILAQIVMFKQNENLLILSTTDQLSMLKNRRALQEFISIENDKMERLKSRKQILIQKTIAFMDLDNFKYYNDTFGHQAGDLIIQCFSNLLKKVFRRSDFISRFGGDEFVVLMTDTDQKEALNVTDRLREALIEADYFIPELTKQQNTIQLKIPDSKKLGFSIGLCGNMDCNNTCNLDEAMRNADLALYYSKEHGKGITTCWRDIKNNNF